MLNPCRSVFRTLVCLACVGSVLAPTTSSGQAASQSSRADDVSAAAKTGDAQRVAVAAYEGGQALTVDGEPFVVNGMNWDYFPIGTNYSYSLWRQPDDVIAAALAEEMPLLRNMGVNAVRMYTGVPARWIRHIYEEYGIYTMLNHSFGRYGLTLGGEWVPNTEYDDPRTVELLMRETAELAAEYRDVPGLLLYLLGNENNYGLFWDGAETEDIPIEDRRSTERARHMYALMNAATAAMKRIDAAHPVAICNGDLLFLDLIAELCPDVDVLGTNMYRGISFGDAFQRVRDEYGKPLLFTEFGSDAFDAVANRENQRAQASYFVGNWREIYANAAGIEGGVGNALGGFSFQFSDGWWKYGQTENLSVHDNNASWSNGGYRFDFVEGQNNMNEEWFGVTAKGATDERGLYRLYPRAAYYALAEAHAFDPYAPGADRAALERTFREINLMEAVLRARGDAAALAAERQGRITLSRLTAQLSTFNTGGSLVSTPAERDPSVDRVYPDELGFDHMQSFFFGVGANPAPGLRASVEFNVLGNVAENPIDQIFYENRGRIFEAATAEGPVGIADNNRVAVYRASVQWSDDNFDLDGFYRTGHYHWGYEGDFFGLYPEANYGPNIDIYNGNAPSGVEIDGKRAFAGLTVAMGPELWWGANPAVLVKYTRDFAGVQLTGIFHEDIDDREATESSFAVPMPKTRRATLHAKTAVGPLGIELGGIWGGQPLEGRAFQLVREAEGVMRVYEDRINADDTWGAKAKLTLSAGPVNWYAQAGAQGLVANGGWDQTITYTGWRLRPTSSGNQYYAATGLTYLLGDLQVAPNFMWQRPIEGPIPGNLPAPARPRNILDDPFSVRANRETVGGELLLTYDPTPATWMYAWDSDESEDARLAVAAGFVFRHHPATLDAAIGILPDGRTLFPFPGGAPPADLWEAHARVVSKTPGSVGLVANLYGGTAQANGSDPRKVERLGGDVRLIVGTYKATLGYKRNDWGPYDYHRDFNLTFPHQAVLDLSKTLGSPRFFALPATRIGLMGTFRTLDRFSPRYCPTRSLQAGTFACDPTAPGFRDGNEWEIRTYLHVNIIQ